MDLKSKGVWEYVLCLIVFVMYSIIEEDVKDVVLFNVVFYVGYLSYFFVYYMFYVIVFFFGFYRLLC